MTVHQGGRKKWTMLSKRERRALIINELNIPKYQRAYLADQTRDTHDKRVFHGTVEMMVRSRDNPDIAWCRASLNKATGSPLKKFGLFIRFVFTRK